MISKKVLNEKIEDLDDDVSQSFRNVQADFQNVFRCISKMDDKVDEFIDELSNNGVIRGLRKLEKRVEDLHKYQTNLARVLDELNTNGVATAINKLNTEVFKDSKNESSDGITNMFYAFHRDYKPDQVPTLAGKVDAIVAHLGLDLTVEPEQKKPASVVAKKKAVKKKGRK